MDGIGSVAYEGLDGAVPLARQPERGAALASISAGAGLIPLADAPDFHQQYLRHMNFGVA